MLGEFAVQVQVSELGVGHQFAVDENGRPDSGAERQQDDDTLDSLCRPETSFGEAGRVSVVDHHNVTAGDVGEDLVGVDTDPGLIQVGRCTNDTALDDTGEPHAHRPLPRALAGEFSYDLSHSFGSSWFWGCDSLPLRHDLTRRDINLSRFHSGSTDIDTKHACHRSIPCLRKWPNDSRA